MGTKSDKPELHRILIVFSKEVESIPASMEYIIEEIFGIESEAFVGQTMKEVYDFIQDEFDKRRGDNYSEEEQQEKIKIHAEQLTNATSTTQDAEEKISDKWDKKEQRLDDEDSES